MVPSPIFRLFIHFILLCSFKRLNLFLCSPKLINLFVNCGIWLVGKRYTFSGDCIHRIFLGFTRVAAIVASHCCILDVMRGFLSSSTCIDFPCTRKSTAAAGYDGCWFICTLFELAPGNQWFLVKQSASS